MALFIVDWQNDCLSLPALEKRKNLIYSLPTSGGKTLVAEILIMKELQIREKNAILLLPYVSIVQEKVIENQTLDFYLNLLLFEFPIFIYSSEKAM